MLDFVSHEAPSDSVFVHGAGGNNMLWNRTLPRLSGRAKALAVNLPGHPSGPISCHSVDEYTDALKTFLDESGMSRPLVCGHSMGSAICLNLAIRHPDLIGGLVIVSGGAKLGVDPLILDGLSIQPMKAIEEIITPKSFFSIDLGLGRESRAALSVSNLPVFLNDYLACKNFDVREKLFMVKARTLILCGDKDEMTPPKWAHYLHSNIVDSEIFFVKDSGHMLPLEKPETLARLIQSFMLGFSR